MYADRRRINKRASSFPSSGEGWWYLSRIIISNNKIEKERKKVIIVEEKAKILHRASRFLPTL